MMINIFKYNLLTLWRKKIVFWGLVGIFAVIVLIYCGTLLSYVKYTADMQKYKDVILWDALILMFLGGIINCILLSLYCTSMLINDETVALELSRPVTKAKLLTIKLISLIAILSSFILIYNISFVIVSLLITKTTNVVLWFLWMPTVILIGALIAFFALTALYLPPQANLVATMIILVLSFLLRSNMLDAKLHPVFKVPVTVLAFLIPPLSKLFNSWSDLLLALYRKAITAEPIINVLFSSILTISWSGIIFIIALKIFHKREL